MANKGKDNSFSTDDKGLWAYVTRSIRPLKREDSIFPPEAKKPQAIKQLTPAPRTQPVQHKSAIFSGPGAHSIDRRTEERLKRGRLPIEATIDLHGMTVAQAQPSLQNFLLDKWEQDLRCVLVITGKGRNGTEEESQTGILRRSLPEWLAAPPLSGIVLRHVPAKGRHGGAGAFYVLLRRRR